MNTKTPEQDKGCAASQLAEEYAEFGTQGVPDSIRKQQLMAKDRMAFLAGYKAGCTNTQSELAVGREVVEFLLEKPKWISVKERLPEMNELCIVNTEWRGIVPATYGNESWIFDEGQGWSEKALSYASHWMPLPEPPKE